MLLKSDWSKSMMRVVHDDVGMQGESQRVQFRSRALIHLL